MTLQEFWNEKTQGRSLADISEEEQSEHNYLLGVLICARFSSYMRDGREGNHFKDFMKVHGDDPVEPFLNGEKILVLYTGSPYFVGRGVVIKDNPDYLKKKIKNRNKLIKSLRSALKK